MFQVKTMSSIKKQLLLFVAALTVDLIRAAILM
jgi:hypothetical protein